MANKWKYPTQRCSLNGKQGLIRSTNGTRWAEKQEFWALAIDLFMHVAMEKQVPSVSARFDGLMAWNARIPLGTSAHLERDTWPLCSFMHNGKQVPTSVLFPSQWALAAYGIHMVNEECILLILFVRYFYKDWIVYYVIINGVGLAIIRCMNEFIHIFFCFSRLSVLSHFFGAKWAMSGHREFPKKTTSKQNIGDLSRKQKLIEK